MGKAKRGRPPATNRERYPSGKLKPDNALAPVVVKRMWDALVTDARTDPRFRSVLAEYLAKGEITTDQFAAGTRLGEVYGRYEALTGRHRSAVSPSYQSGVGRADKVEDEKRKAQIASATKAFNRLQQELPSYPPEAIGIVERVCVEDLRINPGFLDDFRVILDRVSDYFRATPAWQRIKDPGKIQHQWRRPATVKQAVPKKQDPARDDAREAFNAVIGRLRPDLTSEQINEAWGVMIALQDRQKLRRGRI